jgi:hypothetical protein
VNAIEYDQQQARTSEEVIAFLTEDGARYHARLNRREVGIVILHSPHEFNPRRAALGRADYFVEPADTLIGAWERVIYKGKGGAA